MKRGGVQHTGVFNEAQTERFTPLVRCIAFVVLFCFVYQDLATAYGGDYERTLRTLLQPTTIKPAIQHPTGLLLSLSPLKSLFIQEAYADDDLDVNPPESNS